MKFEFRSDKAAGEILAAWWEVLQQDTGGRARMRRCKSPEEVMLEPAFYRLVNRLQPLAVKSGEELSGSDLYRIAAIAGLLAHVTGRDNKPLADRMADPKGGRPLFSSLRFRRLLKEPLHDLYPAMIRVIRQLDKKANLYDLANSVFYWGDAVRKRWALAYFPKVVD